MWDEMHDLPEGNGERAHEAMRNRMRNPARGIFSPKGLQ